MEVVTGFRSRLRRSRNPDERKGKRRMALVLLVRHGQTDWNMTGQIMGRQPIPLNAVGERQARALGTALTELPIERIYASPTLRTQQTGEIIAATHGDSLKVETEEGLVEIGVGAWEGRFWSELSLDPIRHRYYSEADACPPGGETLLEVQRRATAAVERRCTRNGILLFISHADVIRTIVAHYLRIDLRAVRQMRIDHASMTAIKLSADAPELLYLNRVAADSVTRPL